MVLTSQDSTSIFRLFQCGIDLTRNCDKPGPATGGHLLQRLVAFPFFVKKLEYRLRGAAASSALNASSAALAMRKPYSTVLSGTSPCEKWWTNCG